MSNNDGKRLRAEFPRAEQARLSLPRRDPLAVLTSQNATRLPELVAVRFGRMLQSPFAFSRGCAAVMAADLAGGASTDVRVVSCGDAHISNFGFFTTPQGELLFDVDDVDEGGVAPWEWDLKRLTASVYIGGRDKGLGESTCLDAARAAVTSYRVSLRRLMDLTAEERFYSRIDSQALADALTGKEGKQLRRLADKARDRTAQHRIGTHTRDGRLRIDDDLPAIRHTKHASRSAISGLLREYAATIREDCAQLLGQYRVTDVALRVVGVSGVGTRCYVVALQGPAGEPLLLQLKEATASVLVTHGGMPEALPGVIGVTPQTHGHRVVAAQRILQAQSDPFLGWILAHDGERGRSGEPARIDYYWRRLRDMTSSLDLAGLKPGSYQRAGEMCAALLARAHSQSAGAAVAADYLGPSDQADEAFASWARRYADVCERDYEVVRAAAKTGEVPVETGV